MIDVLALPWRSIFVLILFIMGDKAGRSTSCDFPIRDNSDWATREAQARPGKRDEAAQTEAKQKR